MEAVLNRLIYNLWPLLTGRQIVVRIGTEVYEGVLTGLQVPCPFSTPAHRDQPWCLTTESGPVLFDPSNDAVQILQPLMDVGDLAHLIWSPHARLPADLKRSLPPTPSAVRALAR